MAFRRRTFDSWKSQPAHHTADGIVRHYHLVSCPENSSLGVCMARPQRASLSISQVIVDNEGVRGRHIRLQNCVASSPSVESLWHQ